MMREQRELVDRQRLEKREEDRQKREEEERLRQERREEERARREEELRIRSEKHDEERRGTRERSEGKKGEEGTDVYGYEFAADEAPGTIGWCYDD